MPLATVAQLPCHEDDAIRDTHRPLTSPQRESERHPPAGRHLHLELVRRRPRLLRRGSAVALLAVVGPGVLAGLSDDDPAGITTYSILGAKFGYRLLWVLAVSTLALIVFHELGVRMGVVTKKGLLALVRDHYRPRGATLALSACRREPRHAVRRVRRRRGRARPARRRQSLPQRPVGRGRRLAARPARVVSPRRACPARAQQRLRRLHRL